jgi:hypothetical protein
VDVVQRWSVRIAQRVAPAEVDFAAEVGTAYAAGGQARKHLQPRPSVQPGAFGPGTLAADLPLILRALADAGNALRALLGSSYLANALAAGSLVVTLRAARGGGGEGAGKPAAPAETGPPPPVSERHAVALAFDSLHSRLMEAGIPPGPAGQLACELLEELLTDPADAALFVEALSAVPDGDPRPVPPAGKRGRRVRKDRRQ